MLKLLVEQSAQIEVMEVEMDKLIKEKEQKSQLCYGSSWCSAYWITT